MHVTTVMKAEELDGVNFSFEVGNGSIVPKSLGQFRLRFELEPSSDPSRVLRVELPESGAKTWPASDVRVVDVDGTPLPVRRPGIEWGKLSIPIPSGLSAIVVEAVEPESGWSARTTDRDRFIEDETSGTTLRISTWPEGKRAALSLRFDDSHPTHLDVVDPILGEYGFRGTFMINPGEDEPGSRRRSPFQARLADWEALAKRGNHELANHTARHRGATNDEEMEAEISEAAGVIRRLAPQQGKLTALNLGGGTHWTTTRTLRFYLDRYHQFDVTGSLGMDDVYGGRVEAFRKHLDGHLARGLWCRIHYHGIGEGEGASEANFRAALELVKQHREELWVAGISEIFRYQAARDGARLTRIASDANSITFRVETTTDPDLYNRSLEVEAQVPAGWTAATVDTTTGGGEITMTGVSEAEERILRFQVPPKTATYQLRK